ncbi:MAG TPA: CHC2 zinc finger domain-containing protein [Terriglobales bacterium]|nr:CHC2 zinc finger domain-containing protein [Terriglobales bacterium]
MLPPAEQFFRSNTQRFRRHGSRARAVCPFHPRAEHQNFSIDLDRGLYKCFVCGASGDIVKFIMDRDRVDFRVAARQLGPLAPIDSGQAETFRTEQRRLERIDLAADKLAQSERVLRLECRDRIHYCDRVLATPGPWSESQWQRAQAAYILRDEYLLPAYVLLSWGAMAQRIRYVLADGRTRAEMAAAVHNSGGVPTDSGQWREVLA